MDVLTLKDIAELEVGFAFKSSNFVLPQDGTRLLRGDNIAQGEIRWDRAEGWPASLEVNPRYSLRTGDVVLAMDRPWIGAGLKYAVVRDHDVPAFLVQRVARLRAKNGTDQGYLGALIGSPEFTDYVLAVQTGTSIPHISGKQIMAFPIGRLPVLEEQRAIAEVLGALDDKIAANTKLAETADALAISLVRSHFTGKKQPLNEIASVIMGSSPTGETLNESGLGTVFYQGVRDFGFRFPANRIWTTSPTRMAEPGDTLVSVRAPVGRVNLASERTCIGRGLASVRSTRDTPSTLFHLLQASTDIWEPYEAEGTVFGSINRKQLETIQVPMLETGTALEAEIASIEGTIRISIEENRTLAATRDALLPQLMSGKLRVKDIENTMGEMV